MELRLSRSLGFGLHEDVDLTNFTQKPRCSGFNWKWMPTLPTRRRPWAAPAGG